MSSKEMQGISEIPAPFFTKEHEDERLKGKNFSALMYGYMCAMSKEHHMSQQLKNSVHEFIVSANNDAERLELYLQVILGYMIGDLAQQRRNPRIEMLNLKLLFCEDKL